MTKEEMQRYINQCVRDGKSKLETFNRLLEVLGLDFPESPRMEKETEKE